MAISVGAIALDEAQQSVALHGDGPMLVLAGPGTGKTRVGVERIVRLIERGLATPEQILFLAYNRKAAEEARRRLEMRLPGFPFERTILTFHSFALSLRNEFRQFAGLPAAALLTEDAERWELMEQALQQVAPSHLHLPSRPTTNVRTLLRLGSRCRQELVTPEQLEEWARQQLADLAPGLERDEASLYLEAAQTIAVFEQLKAARGLIEFDDALVDALAIVHGSSIRDALRERYRYVTVDEFQDTNLVQLRLLDELVPANGNLLVVADDDQSIYKFRGASRANLERFRARHDARVEVTLGRNYRSTSQIVAASAALIATAAGREDKPLQSVIGPGPAVTEVHARTAEDETQEIARRIAGVRSIDPDASQAVLARTNDQLLGVARGLAALGVPYRFSGGGDFFRADEIKDIRALLEAAADPNHCVHVLRLLRLPPYGVSPETRLALLQELRARGGHIVGVLADPAPLVLDDADASGVRRLLDDISALATLALHASPSAVLHEALARSAFVGAVADTGRAQEVAARLRRLVRLCEQFEAGHPDALVADLIGYLDLADAAGFREEHAEEEELAGIVLLSTAHSAKGLEFTYVYVIQLAENHFPLRERSEFLDVPAELVDEEITGDGHFEDEERRLLYVALTRAIRHLTLSRADHYGAGARQTPPSRFLLPIEIALGTDLERAEAPSAQIQATATSPTAWRRHVPEVLTFGQIDTYGNCPRQYAYRYVYRLPERPTREKAFGDLIHAVLQRAGERRIAGDVVTAADLQAMLDETWNTTRSIDKRAHSDLLPAAQAALARYAADSAWTGAELVEVEASLTLNLDPFTLRLRADRLEATPGGSRIVDTKTGRPPRDPASLRSDLQAGLYALALEQRDHALPTDLATHFVGDQLAVIAINKDADQLERDRRKAWAIARAIADSHSSGQFPARPSEWNCGNCSFRPVCDEGRRFLASQASVGDEPGQPTQR